MKKNIPLETIERWMQSVIEHPGTDDDAWHSREAEQHLLFHDAVGAVLPSASLTSVERIAIYRKMFFLRMTESMAIDYPAVKAFLGEEEFHRLIVEEYVRRYPSRSYTLNHLGRAFPEFLRNSSLPDKEFLSEVAALELAVTNILEADEKPLLLQATIAAVPPDEWGAVRLVPVRAVQLLEFGYNVCAYVDAVTEETALPAPEQGHSFVLVYRNQYRAYWEEIPERQYTLLASLMSGASIDHALAQFVERFPGTESDLQADLFSWFNDWVGKGLFSDIALP